MHACGHDVHATILLGTLITLNELHDRGELDRSVSIRGIFQPAEEVAQGAGEVIDAGGLEGIRAIFGFHVDPSREVGRIGLKTGVQTAFCDEVLIEVSGEGGHSARPHETDDPILAAVQLVSALYGQLPRKIDSRAPVVLSVTRIAGGSTSNIIPAEVKIGGTLRALDITSLTDARETIHRVAAGIATATRTAIRVSIEGKCPGVINDGGMIACVRTVATELSGADRIDNIDASIGGEDFAFYTQKIPGALVRIGCGSESAGYHDLHSPHFTVDERTIKIAINLMVNGLIRWSRKSNGKTAGLAELK